MSSTSSSDINIGACFEFPSAPVRAGLPPAEPGFALADYWRTLDSPTPAEIEQLTQFIIAEILRGLPGQYLDPPQN